jgi:adenine deaminase
MTRRILLTLLCLLPLGADPVAEPDDLIIRHGRIVDGTGNPWFHGDVAVRGDRIVAVGRVPSDLA